MQPELFSLDSTDLTIPHLGPRHLASPLISHPGQAGQPLRFVTDEERILVNDHLLDLQSHLDQGLPIPSFEKAGPREKIFFEPTQTKCAIVTCGGLCPGLNDVIRGLVMQLYHRYGVTRILGVRYGYEGFIEKYGHPMLHLHPEDVESINLLGGTILGSSRGPQDIGEIVDQLASSNVNLLFVIGGDGSLRGAQEIALEVERRNLHVSVIGIPKTIDNDIMYIDKSFGFETAFAEAVKTITSAHVEARGAYNGIGMVKLMGRHSGFIACFAALAEGEANFVLIPEVPFKLEGEHGFLHELENRLTRRKHAVIVVAEGAGQDLCASTNETDASGNQKLTDIGLFLRDRIHAHFKNRGIPVSLKYIDPSYQIRSVCANPQDSVFCNRLAQNAVHAAMAGKTRMLVGRWHGHFIHLPIPLVTSGRRQVDPNGELWMSVLESTGQKAMMM